MQHAPRSTVGGIKAETAQNVSSFDPLHRDQRLESYPFGSKSRTDSVKANRSPALHAYTVFMAVSILVLICSGGLVTSNDAGLAVPDWPTSFGYNMFAFPLSRWLAPGGVRLEHAHRLIATAEGTLTIILAV